MNTDLSTPEARPVTQEEILSCDANRIVVTAGAGSGKTRVLVERYLNALAGGKNPSRILVVTYTEKAAHELRERIFDSLKKNGQSLLAERVRLEGAIQTLHGWALSMTEKYPVELGLDPDARLVEREGMRWIEEEAWESAFEALLFLSGPRELACVWGERKLRDNVFQIHAEWMHAMTPLSVPVPDGDAWKESFKELNDSVRRYALLTDKPIPSRWLDFAERGAAVFEDAVRRGLSGEMAWVQENVDEGGWYEDLRAWTKERASKFRAAKEELRTCLDACFEWFADGGSLFAARSLKESVCLYDRHYRQQKRLRRAMDFDDLIRCVWEHWAAYGDNAFFMNSYDEVLVDECQDLSRVQMNLLQALSLRGKRFLVGDLRQSIYGFRHARPELFREEAIRVSRPQQGEWLAMNQNFRSRPELIAFVNRCFAGNGKGSLEFESRLEARREPQTPLLPIETHWVQKSPKDSSESGASDGRRVEAARIARRLRLLVSEGIRPADIAVLVPVMTHAASFADALKAEGIPAELVKGRSFYDELEVRDMIHFLRVWAEPGADLWFASLLKSPWVGLSDETLLSLVQERPEGRSLQETVLERWHESVQGEKRRAYDWVRFMVEGERRGLNEEPGRLLRTALDRSGYERRVFARPEGLSVCANIRKFIDRLHHLPDPWAHDARACAEFFKKTCEWGSEEAPADIATVRDDAVRIMTVHQAKGLEFPVVLLAGMDAKGRRGQKSGQSAVRDDGSILCEYPLGFSAKPLIGRRYRVWLEAHKERENEENKRLLYVAMTRARDRLILSGVLSETSERASADETDAGSVSVESWTDILQSNYPELITRDNNEKLTGDGFEVVSMPHPFEEDAPALLKARPKIKSVPGEEESSGQTVFSLPDSKQKADGIIEEISVTELVHNRRGVWLPETGRIENAPAFITPPDIIGKAFHELARHWDYRIPADKQWALLLKRIGMVLPPPDEAGLKGMMERYLQTPPAIEMADLSNRNARFFRELPLGAFFSGLNGARIMLKAQADLVYHRGDAGWMIVDYKTGQVRRESDEEQLRWYRLCLGRILNEPIEACLYYAWTAEWVPVSDDEDSIARLGVETVMQKRYESLRPIQTDQASV